MLKKLLAVSSATAALATPLLFASPASAAEASDANTNINNRCALYVVNAGPGTIRTCSYVTSSIDGMAVWSVVQGAVHLDIHCTYGSYSSGRLQGPTAGTAGYPQIGTCTAALYVDNNAEYGKATAFADVGSTGI